MYVLVVVLLCEIGSNQMIPAIVGILQYLLRGTADSPLEVLRRHQDISLLNAIGLTVLVFVIEAGLLNFASAFMPNLYNADITPFESNANSALELSLTILGVAILVPFYEELIFRGLALKAYRDARSTLFAVLFTSALFGFIHGTLVDALVFFPPFVLVALMVIKTGQLWTAIVVHGLGNFIATLLLHFDIEMSPSMPTAGIVGLVVAATAFWLGFWWLKLPKADMRSGENTEQRSIWTLSLVIVLIVVVLFNFLTTLGALEPTLDNLL